MSRLPQPLKLTIGNCGYFLFTKYISLKGIKPEVKTADETVEYIYKNKVSIARYGDGELLWAFENRQNGNFEKNSPELAIRLRKIIKKPIPNLIIGIPDIFENLNCETNTSKTYWEGLLIRHGVKIVKLLRNRKVYFDSRFTRPYMDKVNFKINFNDKFNNIKKIWKDRNVLIVEGNKTRFGVGNDLLQEAKSIKRVICPSVNAFESYKDILKCTLEVSKTMEDPLVLIALGPTATVLTYDLTCLQIQAIDIGHLDVEYDWYKLGAKTKVPIRGKYVNEANPTFIGDFDNEELANYYNQIIKKVG